MSDVNWDEWEEHREYIKKHKQTQKLKIRNLLESDVKEITITLKEFIDMYEDDEYKLDMLDLLEEALMRIADGQENPAKIAMTALNKYRGDE